MGSFESKQLTPQEQMKQYKREIQKAVRELDKEIRQFEVQKTKLESDIRAAAKVAKGKEDKVLTQRAKDYVRTKKTIEKFYTMRTHLQGVMINIQTAKSTAALTSAMQNSVKAMKAMNARLNMPQLNAIMQQFANETGKMEDTQEMMGEAIDDAFDAVDDEEAEKEVVDQVMEELKLDMSAGLRAVPSSGMAVPQAAPRAAVASPAGAGAGPAPPPPGAGPKDNDGSGGGGALPAPPPSAGAGAGARPGGGGAAADDLAARLAGLRK